MRIVHLTTAHGPDDIRMFHKECCTLAEASYDVILVCPDTHAVTRRAYMGIQYRFRRAGERDDT